MRRIYPWPKTRDEHAGKHQQRAGVMSQPLLYFMRHGETDWNAERRLQGQHDIPLNAVGRGQASRCGEIMRALWERDGRDREGFDFVSSPLGRARETMELMRTGLGLDPARYRTEPRLAELSFGRWEGFTFAELQRDQADIRALAARDTVVVAHGGVARTLIVHLGIEPAAAAPVHDIEQGVVYRFAPEKLTRFA